MSSTEDFILNWLNQTLKIQPPIKNIPKEFSNGYKFAILLNTLNEITNEELSEFSDSNNMKEIKSNFKKIKAYFHTKLNLDIREDEFNEVINKDVSKSVVILYKIKNSVQKKKINFLEIKTSDIKLTQEELNLKIQELMRETTKDNNEESYTFAMSYGLNASTAEGMNVATKKLNTLMANKTKVFVSVSTRADDWNKTLSLKLNSYIERNSQGGF